MTATNPVQQPGVSPVSCDEVLRVAHRDALAAYRDLSGYRITLVLQPDGWHVDYDLVDPYVAGGGPHYVIDPATGAILSKRYDQ
jgi:hypothetical protein